MMNEEQIKKLYINRIQRILLNYKVKKGTYGGAIFKIKDIKIEKNRDFKIEKIILTVSLRGKGDETITREINAEADDNEYLKVLKDILKEIKKRQPKKPKQLPKVEPRLELVNTPGKMIGLAVNEEADKHGITIKNVKKAYNSIIKLKKKIKGRTLDEKEKRFIENVKYTRELGYANELGGMNLSEEIRMAERLYKILKNNWGKWETAIKDKIKEKKNRDEFVTVIEGKKFYSQLKKENVDLKYVDAWWDTWYFLSVAIDIINFLVDEINTALKNGIPEEEVEEIEEGEHIPIGTTLEPQFGLGERGLDPITIYPVKGPIEGGIEITIKGEHLNKIKRVLFNDGVMKIKEIGDGLIKGILPAGEEGPAVITLEENRRDDKGRTYGDAFTYIKPPEKILSLKSVNDGQIIHLDPYGDVTFGKLPGCSVIIDAMFNENEVSKISYENGEFLLYTTIGSSYGAMKNITINRNPKEPEIREKNKTPSIFDPEHFDRDQIGEQETDEEPVSQSEKLENGNLIKIEGYKFEVFEEKYDAKENSFPIKIKSDMPVIESIERSSGRPEGGEKVIIKGKNLDGVLTILFGRRGMKIDKATSDKISGETPEGEEGPCDVTAYRDDSLYYKKKDGYTYEINVGILEPLEEYDIEPTSTSKVYLDPDPDKVVSVTCYLATVELDFRLGLAKNIERHPMMCWIDYEDGEFYLLPPKVRIKVKIDDNEVTNRTKLSIGNEIKVIGEGGKEFGFRFGRSSEISETKNMQKQGGQIVIKHKPYIKLISPVESTPGNDEPIELEYATLDEFKAAKFKAEFVGGSGVNWYFWNKGEQEWKMAYYGDTLDKDDLLGILTANNIKEEEFELIGALAGVSDEVDKKDRFTPVINIKIKKKKKIGCLLPTNSEPKNKIYLPFDRKIEFEYEKEGIVLRDVDLDFESSFGSINPGIGYKEDKEGYFSGILESIEIKGLWDINFRKLKFNEKIKDGSELRVEGYVFKFVEEDFDESKTTTFPVHLKKEKEAVQIIHPENGGGVYSEGETTIGLKVEGIDMDEIGTKYYIKLRFYKERKFLKNVDELVNMRLRGVYQDGVLGYVAEFKSISKFKRVLGKEGVLKAVLFNTDDVVIAESEWVNVKVKKGNAPLEEDFLESRKEKKKSTLLDDDDDFIEF